MDLGSSLVWILYWIINTFVTLLCILLAGFHRFRNLRNYGLIFVAVMYMTYVLRPSVAFIWGPGMISMEYTFGGISKMMTEDWILLSLLYSSAMLFFALGYRKVQRTYMDVNKKVELAYQTHNFETLRWIALLMILLGYFSFFFAKKGFIGISTHQVSYEITSAGTGFTNTTGYIELANYLVVSGCFLYYASKGKLSTTILLVMPWAINQLYQGWSRNVFFAMVLGLFAININQLYGRGGKVRPNLILFLLVLVSVFYLFVTRTDRFLFQKPLESHDLLTSALSKYPDSVLGDFAGIEGTWVMAKLDVPPKYGAEIFYNFFVRPIPRILWKSKPYPGDFSLRELFGYSANYSSDNYIWYTGNMVGSIGSALRELGYLGVPFTFFITGLFLAWIEKKTIQDENSPIWLATYAATYGMTSLLGRAAIYDSFMLIYVLIYYLPYYIAFLIIKNSQEIRNRSQARDPRSNLVNHL